MVKLTDMKLSLKMIRIWLLLKSTGHW